MHTQYTPLRRALMVMAALASAAGIALLVCFNLLVAKNPGNIAIIGGADGPTAIFLSGNQPHTESVTARILEIDAQNMTLRVEGTAQNSVLGDQCIVRCKDALFIKTVSGAPQPASILDLRVGDEVTMSVGAVAESYPTQTTAYLIQFEAQASAGGIPQEIALALKSFPDAYSPERGVKDGLFVVLHGNVQGDTRKVMTDFLSGTAAKQPSKILLVQYTLEGDPIFTSLTFDGTTYQSVTDNTRDVFAGCNAGLTAYSAKYLFAFEDGAYTHIFLSDDANLTLEQAQSGGQCLHIVSYAQNAQK